MAGREWCGRRTGRAPSGERSRHSQSPARCAAPASATSTTILLQILASLQRLQQGMDHPPVRSRSAGRHASSSRWSASHDDGPGDAAVVTPVLGSWARPRDRLRHQSALRRSRSVRDGGRRHRRGGAQRRRRRRRSARIAILDNFCWGNTDRPEVLGSLVRAAEACRDVALAYGMPFISGKDSLNNEFHAGGRNIVIPPTLLISAAGPASPTSAAA